MNMNETNLWNQLNQYVDLYKFHWELALKLCVFFLGISGAVAAYVIKNQETPYMAAALVLPFVLCTFGAGLSHRSLPGLKLIREEAVRIGDELELPTHPEFRSLVTFVKALRFILGGSAVGLVALGVIIGFNS
ncbi:hypothetical protein [Marinimicrobium sp. LS-A18]|uniref:hypothetical protein n=1 Tax=Marinimicrobium sp. LS-A18 TaxID=1381596 RepID=UPI00046701CD|nr:hypothetical protein [Marinimicrobium sp. LS-A18]